MCTPASSKTSFQAPWPESMRPTLCKKSARFAWNFFSTIVFPIGLVRLANHFVFRPLILRNALMPSLKARSLLPGEICFSLGRQVAFKTPLGQSIEGLYVPAADRSAPIDEESPLETAGEATDKKLLIFVGGNAMDCSDVLHNKVVTESCADILSVNPIGVGRSEGFPGRESLDLEESLALPVFSAYEYARNLLGYEANSICLYGFSLGGVATALGAQLIQEKHGPEAIKLISDRSLRSVARVASAWALRFKHTPLERFFSALPNPSYKPTLRDRAGKLLIGFIPDRLIQLIVALGIRLVGVKADAQKAFLSLKTKEKCVIYSETDEVIPYAEGAALIRGVEGKTALSIIDLNKDSETAHGHNTPICEKKQREVTEKIHAFLQIDASPAGGMAESDTAL